MKAAQLEFQRSAGGSSQNAKVLQALREAAASAQELGSPDAAWVGTDFLERLSGSHRMNSRIAECRKIVKEFATIEHKAGPREGNAYRGFYRLVYFEQP